MKIPENALDRIPLYADLRRQCSDTRDDRLQFYSALRNYYLWGSGDDSGTEYNKIANTIETLTSFIYSPAGIRFHLEIGTTADKAEVWKVPVLRRELNSVWKTSNTHLLFELAVTWGLVFGCMLIKAMWTRNQFRTYLVEPHQFGVLNEAIIDIADQEAFCHYYTITKTQLQHELKDQPDKLKRIMEKLDTPTKKEASGFTDSMGRLMVSSSVAGVPGSLAIAGGGGSLAGGISGQGNGPNYSYTPKVMADLVPMSELYVWNDDIDNYQIVTMAGDDGVIYDREQFGVKGVPNFVPIRPENQLYDYFWGSSFLAKLVKLQDRRTARMEDIKMMLGKQVDPPISAIGVGGLQDERLAALRTRGGQASSPQPGGSINVHKQEIPADVFGDVDRLDGMFDDTAGIRGVLAGGHEQGVRSKSHADLLARLSSARPKKRAVVVEEDAENLANLALRLIQENSTQRFRGGIHKDGEELTFLANQFTMDFSVKVDAHSGSPIFVEDRKHDAEILLKARAISRERFLEMMDPPDLQTLQEELKLIEAKEARAQQINAEARAKHEKGAGNAKE